MRKVVLIVGLATLVGCQSTEVDERLVELDAKLAELSVVVASGDYAPTQQSFELCDELVERVDTQFARLQEVVDTDLAAFVNLLHELEVPAVVAE